MASVTIRPACALQDASSQDVASKGLDVEGPIKGKAQSRATLDELLATLRLLEQEPEPLPTPRADHKDKYSWTDEVTAACVLPRPSPGFRCRPHRSRAQVETREAHWASACFSQAPNKGPVDGALLNPPLTEGLAEV